MANNVQIKTPQFLLSFPALFEPRSSKNGGEPKYSLLAIFKKGTDLSVLQQAAREAALAHWPKGLPRGFKKPFHDGDVDADPEWGDCFKGSIYVRMSSKYQPPVVNAAKQEIKDPNAVYGGQTCVAICHVYAYDQAGNQGISFGLDAVQVVADGERIGGFDKKATIAQFDQLAPAEPQATDLFDSPAPQASVPAAAGTATAGSSDPFDF